MTIPECVKSKKFKISAVVVGVLILMLGSFASGVFVGFHKARFSYSWGENYERNFMGPQMGRSGGPGGMMRQFEGRDFRNPHGLAGTIISITDNNLVVKDKDNKENTVAINDQTVIKNRGGDLKLSDLKVNDQIVMMGDPGDNGVVNAKLIRVFDNNNNPTN